LRDGSRRKTFAGTSAGRHAGRILCSQGDLAKSEGPAGVIPPCYFDKGSLAVIGRASAVADVFGAHLSGFIGWLVWIFIHLIYLVTFRSRVLIFVQWAIQNLTFSRGARLITGRAPSDFNFSKELSEIKPEPINAPR
jgi:NADH:ubiquinone reductase (H+-translocating)